MPNIHKPVGTTVIRNDRKNKLVYKVLSKEKGYVQLINLQHSHKARVGKRIDVTPYEFENYFDVYCEK